MLSLFPSRAVALEFFGWPVHWYGLMYLAAFLLAYVLLPRLQHFRGLQLTREQWMDILASIIVGVLVGGRLGYVFFYAPFYFAQHPLEIFAVWQGGMASHGGFIGVTIALLHSAWRLKISVLSLADIIVVPVALGMVFGRTGNFINQELYGTVTSLPWGIAVPGVEGLRHPWPLYAALSDLCLAGMCFLHLRSVRSRPGTTVSVFLVLYAVQRFLLEFLRAQDVTGMDIGFMMLTRGQALTLGIFILGIAVGLWSSRPSPRTPLPTPRKG